MTLLRGQADGSLALLATLAVPYGAASVACAALNGNGHLDLAVAGTHQVTVLAGRGDGTFPRHAVYDLGATPLAVALADVNADGQRDLVAANADDDNLSVLLNQVRSLWHAPHGSVRGPVSTIRLHFPAPMDTGSFDPAEDVASFIGPEGAIAVAGYAWLNQTTLEVRFDAQSVPGLYRMVLGPNILDVAGEPMNVDGDSLPGETPDDQYVATFVLTVQLEDLGTVDFLERPGLSPAAGDLWFQLRAARAGLLTLEALFDPIGGTAQLTLFNTAFQRLADSVPAAGGQRIDYLTSANATYVVRLAGTHSSVGLRLTNLVSRSGAAVDVYGTSASDQLTLTAGSTLQIGINGTPYAFDPAEVATVRFDGGAGADAASLVGGASAETVVMRAATRVTTLTSPTLTVEVRAAEDVSFSGDAADLAFLYDTPQDETFTASPTEALLAGAGFSYRVAGVGQAHGYATAGGRDSAHLYDSAGDETLVAKPDYATLSGPGFFLRAKKFDEVIVHAAAGGYDVAQFTDSSGNDTLVGDPESATLAGPGFSVTALGFDVVHAYARSGGYDTARLTGSPAPDRFVAEPDYGKLFGATFFLRAKFFEEVTAIGGGSSDLAQLIDSSGNDVLDADLAKASLYLNTADPANAGRKRFANTAVGFATTVATASQGGFDTAYLRDSVGDEVFTGRATQASMVGSGVSVTASRFEAVYGYATRGGYDVAHLYTPDAGGTFTAQPNQATLIGSGYALRLKAFDEVHAHGTAGTNDVASLFDSPGNDHLQAEDRWAKFQLASPALAYWVYDFDRVHAYSSNAGDTKDVNPNTADWLFLVGW